MKKPDPLLDSFKPGDRVRLRKGILHLEYVGLIGRVKKTVKYCRMVDVEFDDGRVYRAYPENVEHINEEDRS